MARGFLGTYRPRLDEKGRLFLPAKYRDELAGGVVITTGHERCLFVFTEDEWERRSAELSGSDLSDRSARNYARVMFGSAFDQKPDKTGRVTVPAGLRTYASLDRDCVVIGVNDRLEIWDAASFDQMLAAQELEFADRDEVASR